MINSKKLLCLILAMILALFCVAAVSCDETPTEPDNGDNGSTDRTEWPEAGVYYFDGEAGENTITLNEGGTFSLYVNGVLKSGKYTLTGSALELTFLGADAVKLNATYANGTVSMTYESANLVFQQKLNFTVSFDMDGADAIAAQTVTNGKYAVKPADPTREGYVFVGWYTDAAYTARYAFGAQPIKADTTVYARWTEKTASGNEYTVVLNANCDDVTNPET